MPATIKELYAFVSVDPQTGDEGIIGMQLNGEWMPFIGADMARVADLKRLADDICLKIGRTYSVYYFTDRKDITEEVKK